MAKRQELDHRAGVQGASAWAALGWPAKALLGSSALVLIAMVLAPAHALSNDEAEPAVGGAVAATVAQAEPPAPPTDAQIAPVEAARPPVRVAAVQPAAPVEAQRGPVTRLPVPRYVSLKGDQGNVRRGPSLSHRIDWVFHHAGMPLRVVGEFGHWRRIEDRDGAGGWVHYQLLSGVRTAIVQQEMVELRSRPDLNAGVIAMAEGGAIVKLGECNSGWCRISGAGAKGWVPKQAIWGVDPDEMRD
ncbi:MAG: SH3 domain-containing protein [Paracoccus sp. (in: a-proteobacteria)]